MLKEDIKRTKMASLIVAVLATTWFVSYQQERSSFASIFLLAFILLFSIGMGIGLLIMRLFGINRNAIGLIYHTTGLINLLFGVVSLIAFHEGDGALIKILSLLIGVVMYADILRPGKIGKDFF